MKALELKGEGLTVSDVQNVAFFNQTVKLSQAAEKNMTASFEYLHKEMASKKSLYGVNTGFGALSSVKISDEDILTLQKNLIRSHSVGVGLPFSKPQTRALMLLRANALARGHSGVSHLLVEKILEFLNKDIWPVIYQQGSVGASGDLAPLAHLALNLIGEGELWECEGEKKPAKDILKQNHITPYCLQPKDGLALINGCQAMTALGLLSVFELQHLSHWMDTLGALSLEALKGSRFAFHEAISQSRPHGGEVSTAKNLRRLLGDTSEIGQSHQDCLEVQDAYSLRCMPAVHGALKVALQRTLETLEVEANSSTDNPLVFAEKKQILSCGNFHGEPVAFVLDYLALALTGASSMSERRIEKLINPAMSKLPAFLAFEGGLNSGYMMAHVTAAALVSENKILSHPASVDSIPTSANKEDHVSMGLIAARKLHSCVQNVKNILAIELICACQALDFLKPLKPSEPLQEVYHSLRKKVPFAKEDRLLYKDIDMAREVLETKPSFFKSLKL